MPRPSARDPRRSSALLLAFAAAVLALSLGVVVHQLGPGALAGGDAHESETRSLLGVVLYPAHALRELPHLLVLALIWLGAVAPTRGGELGAQLGRLALLTTAVGGVLFAAAAIESGPLSAWRDLAQTRAAFDLAGPGVHFRFHLLSDIALGGLLYAVGRAIAADRDGRPAAAVVGLGLFGAALLTWGVDDVTSARYVGHAGREVETGLLVALPVLAAMALRRPGAAPAPLAALRRYDVRFALAAATSAAAALCAHAVGVDLMAASSAPSRPVALNLAVHHFEHLFDLLFLVTATRLEERRRDRQSGGRRRAPGRP